MSTSSEPNDSRPNDSRRALREQIAEDRQELAETVTALRNKTDLKARVLERTADVEIAVTGIAGRAGRTLHFVPGVVRWAVTTAADRMGNKVPSPVRAPIEKAVGLVRSFPPR